jgi:outer membrane protein TolC
MLLQPGVRGAAQTGSPFDPLKDNIGDKLPPLRTLIDSALANDPGMKYSNLQVTVNKGILHSSKAQWTQNFGLQANYGYGTFDYLYNSTAGGQAPPTYTLQQSLSQYGVGAYLRIPLFDIVNRRNEVKTAKAGVSQALTLVESRQMEIREQVIRQFNEVVVKQRLLRIKSRYLETSRINLQMAEKGFMNGTVTVDDYSQVSEIEARTESDFENTRMEFLTAYMILEEITGLTFNLYNETTR